MKEETLKQITHTIEGYPIKDLRYKPIDNILVGLVKHPIFGKPQLHDGYISVQFTVKGYPINRFKGEKDLQLNFGKIK